MPTMRELLTLVYAGGSNPSIDQTCFPNTTSSFVFWSGSSCVLDPTDAWSLIFNVPQMYGNAKEDGNGYVRVVRGGQF